ncbi:hypothetical protein K8T06_17905, partial [bacterium]|nr:hypothetical protein [bacterium]
MNSHPEKIKAEYEKKNGVNRRRIQFRRQRRTVVAVVLAVGDLFFISLGFLVGYYLRFYQELGVHTGWVKPVPVAPPDIYIRFLVLVNVVFLLIFTLLRLYKRDRARGMLDELHGTWRALNLGFVFVASVTFFMRSEDFQFSRLVILYTYIICMILVPSFRLFVLKCERWVHAFGSNSSNVLIIGSGEMAQIVIRKLTSNPALGYRIAGICTETNDNSSQ